MSNFRIKLPYKTIKTLFISLTLILLITSLVLPGEIFAGSGSFEEGGPPYKINLNLLFAYNASHEVIDIFYSGFYSIYTNVNLYVTARIYLLYYSVLSEDL